MNIVWRVNTASVSQIGGHLLACDQSFAIPLSERVSIAKYSAKLEALSVCLEAWDDSVLVGLLAYYENDNEAFITSVSVIPAFEGRGIGRRLVQLCQSRCRESEICVIRLEVHEVAASALMLYESQGFQVLKCTDGLVTMKADIGQ